MSDNCLIRRVAFPKIDRFFAIIITNCYCILQAHRFACVCSRASGTETMLANTERKRIFSSSVKQVNGHYRLGLIWSFEPIVNDHLTFRTNVGFSNLYLPFDSLLFFADAGNEDQFAFPIYLSSARCQELCVWNHEDDSRTWVAPSLATYLEWWLNGTIKL